MILGVVAPFVVLCYFLSFLVGDFSSFLLVSLPPFSQSTEEMQSFEPFSKKTELIAVFNIQYNPKDSSLLCIKTTVVCLHL